MHGVTPALRLSVTQHLTEIDPQQWNSLLRQDNPFLRHEFLHSLETTRCVCNDTGWEPNHLALYNDNKTLVGAMPLYLKHHSWGEYVFDWAWADAYQRAGLEYYPKLLSAIPFTPVTGPRFLIHPDHPDPAVLRETLARGLLEAAHHSRVSSLHILFTNRNDNEALARHGLLLRTGNQFHWRNHNYANFSDYLTSFTSAKRKKIRRERRRVQEAGIQMEVLQGSALKSEHWDAMHRFYRLTVYNHGAAAYLNRQFFEQLQHAMSDHAVMFFARHGGRYVGGALNLLGGDTLYGRYWGADKYYEGLHFEACYYQPIDYCIRNGMTRFEAGAQGEHKLSRGLLPTPTYSAHWVRDSRFRHAVAEFLQAETEHVERYSDVLRAHTPFRDGNRKVAR